MKFVIKVIFKALKILIRGVMLPINVIVGEFFPDVAEVVGMVNLFFQNITSGILWVKSWLPFTTGFYTTLVAIITFRLTVPLLVHGIKLLIKWYNVLKP